jgi:hypothetical protein
MTRTNTGEFMYPRSVIEVASFFHTHQVELVRRANRAISDQNTLGGRYEGSICYSGSPESGSGPAAFRSA